MTTATPSTNTRATGRSGLTLLLAAILATLSAAVPASGSLLIAMDWQTTAQGDVLNLTFDRAPAPQFENVYDSANLEARLTFWETGNAVPTVLRQLAPGRAGVASVNANTMAFGDGEAVQLLLRFQAPVTYTPVADGSRVKVLFAEAAAPSKGDSRASAEESEFTSGLAGLVSFERQPIVVAQNDTAVAIDDLPPIESTTDGASAEIVPTTGEDLPDMSAILGQGFDVPAQEQKAFVPEIGDANKKYAGLFGDDTALLDDALWNKRIESLKFRETPLQDALRLIAARSGLNILFNSRLVKGEITTELKDVPLGEALEAILRVNDLAAVRQGNIVRIVPRSEVFSDRIEYAVRSRPLNWVRAESMAAILKKFVSSEGEIVPSRDANALVIKDSPTNLARLMELIDRLDVPEKQVTIEVMAIDFNVTMARSQGFNWNVARPDDHALNLIRAFDTNAETPDGVALVRPATYGDRQLAEVFGPYSPLVGEDGFGRALAAPAGFGGLSPLKVDQAGVRNPINGSPNFAWEVGTDVTFLGQRFSLEASLQALENQNLLSVLAQPKVTTLNNIPAEIRIVRKEPFFETIQNPGSNNVSTTVKFEDIGLTVRATPNITNNDFVRMQIETEQKIFVGRETDGATGATGIISDQRTFNSNIVVKDENTVSMGGLRSLDTTNSEQGTPWLRRAPMLGWLFKSIDRRQDKKELLLFVTPKIVKDPRLTEFEQGRFDQLDLMWALPDYFFDDSRVVPDDFFQNH